jgi:hypothetical protein
MSKLESLVQRLRGSPENHERDLAEMFPPKKIEAIKRRERRRFRETQDKKWANWLNSVSR